MNNRQIIEQAISLLTLHSTGSHVSPEEARESAISLKTVLDKVFPLKGGIKANKSGGGGGDGDNDADDGNPAGGQDNPAHTD